MNDDPSGTAHAASVLPVPAAAALLIVFFLLGILYAMCDSAVTTASESRVKRDAENGSRRAKKFLAYLDANESFASPLQFGMMLMGFFSIGVSVLGFTPALDNALIAAGLLPGLAAAAAVVLCMLLCAVLFLLAADFIPKKFVAHKAARSLQYNYKLIGLIRTLSASMRPLMRLCDLISDGVMRLFGNDPRALDETVTEEEILHMVGEGEEKGVIEETELDMITNILDFNDTTVSEIMTHRTEVSAVEDTDAIGDVVKLSIEKGYSRIPVYHEDIDTILGVIFVKDLLKYVGKEFSSEVKLTDLLRPAYFVPESKLCSQLFQEMTSQHFQFAVIVDEYGGTEGIVTLEDILESIVGNIQDEYDNEEEEIYKVSDNAYTVDGSTNIDEVSDLVGVDLPEGDYDTIAGLVVEHLGRIPKEGEHPAVTIENLTLTVEKVEDRRIAKILIVKEVPPAEPEDEEPDKEKEKEKGRKKEKNA